MAFKLSFSRFRTSAGSKSLILMTLAGLAVGAAIDKSVTLIDKTSDGTAAAPLALDPSKNPLTGSSIWITFAILQLALLTQPVGSLVYTGRMSILWRMSPVIAAYEGLLIVFYLLFQRWGGRTGGYREMASTLLYIRGLPVSYYEIREGMI